MTIVYTIIVAFALAFVLGVLLGIFKKFFHVPVDPTVEKIRAVLSGGNCGGCGYPGCDGFAAACAKGLAPVDGCTAGGVATAKKIAEIMGQSVSVEQKVAVVACGGSKEHSAVKGEYIGIKSCAAAKQSINGTKMCAWACIGFGDCVNVCKFNAISIKEDGIAHVDAEKCTGCGVCATVCPQKLISRVSASQKGVFVNCSNRSQNKPAIIKNCKSGCIKCGKCERTCTQKAIHLVDGLPVVDYALCNACGDCVTGCPTKVLSLRNS